LYRRTRRKIEGSGTTNNIEGSSTPTDISNENNCHLPVPSLPSQMNNSTSSGLLYLQSEFAVFTRSLAQCNIGELIRQPQGVDKNEWIANHSLYYF
jgi:hypothetical protein